MKEEAETGRQLAWDNREFGDKGVVKRRHGRGALLARGLGERS